MPPVKSTPLSLSLGVNALTVCDCGATAFKVGLAYNSETGNNFLRLLECVACGFQMAVIHQADSGLAPSVSKLSG